MTDEFFAANRKRLFDTLGPNFNFSIASKCTDFDWLTGLGRFDNLVYEAVGREGIVTETLYIPAPDMMTERWYGRMLHPEEVRGIPVRDRSEYTGDPKGSEAIAVLRAYKQDEEIENLRKSIELTARGLEALKSVIIPGKYEYNLRAEFEKVIADEGYKEPAFSTIVAAGENSLCLHYDECSKRLEKGDIVLIDLGARVGFNGADISRTYGATDEQKELIRITADCVDYVCSKSEPGINLKRLNEIQDEYLSKHIGGDVREYRWHNISHHLGFDVHDECGRDQPMDPGSVFTLEVGVYFQDKGWGIRTEDDVYMTENGAINLSKDIIPRI